MRSIVEAVVGIVGVGVLLHGADIVGMRPALPERPDPVVHAVIGALHRKPRALRRRHLDVGEGLEQVAVAEVDVPDRAVPGQRPGEVLVAVRPAPRKALHLGSRERPDIGALGDRLLQPRRIHLLPLRRRQLVRPPRGQLRLPRPLGRLPMGLHLLRLRRPREQRQERRRNHRQPRHRTDFPICSSHRLSPVKEFRREIYLLAVPESIICHYPKYTVRNQRFPKTAKAEKPHYLFTFCN